MSKIWNSLGLAIIGIALLMGSAYAADSGTTTIGATLGDSFAIIAPGAVSNWALSIGDNTYTTSTAGSVSSNVAWKVQVKEAGGDGQLASSIELPADKIAAPIHAINGVTYDVTMSEADNLIATGDATNGVPASLDIDYSQVVVDTDPKHNDYTMTLTYTVSTNL